MVYKKNQNFKNLKLQKINLSLININLKTIVNVLK